MQPSHNEWGQTTNEQDLFLSGTTIPSREDVSAVREREIQEEHETRNTLITAQNNVCAQSEMCTCWANGALGFSPSEGFIYASAYIFILKCCKSYPHDKWMRLFQPKGELLQEPVRWTSPLWGPKKLTGNQSAQYHTESLTIWSHHCFLCGIITSILFLFQRQTITFAGKNYMEMLTSRVSDVAAEAVDCLISKINIEIFKSSLCRNTRLFLEFRECHYTCLKYFFKSEPSSGENKV